MIGRRAILTGGFAALTMPNAALAQSMRRIGYLHPVTADPQHVSRRILSETWRRLGYVDGETALVRAAGGDGAQLGPLAQQLADAGAGVIIAVGAETVVAAARATTLPVVAIDLETDPVRAGFASSFNKPGGRITGVFMDQSLLAAKWIELLIEVAPGLERVALLWNPATGRGQPEIAAEAAESRGLASSVIEIDYRGSFESTVAKLGGRGLGLVQLTSPGSTLYGERLAKATIVAGVPSVSFLSVNAKLGLLLGYGPDQERLYPRAAIIADQILRGRDPATIPIERPDRFDLGINLATARSLGISLPQSLLIRADEVFE